MGIPPSFCKAREGPEPAGTFVPTAALFLLNARNPMQHKLIHEAPGQHGPQRTFAVVLETGDEVMACLKDFIAREKIHAAQITAIGALSNVVLNYFDWERKAYQNIPVAEQVEVASLIGDVAEAPDG